MYIIFLLLIYHPINGKSTDSFLISNNKYFTVYYKQVQLEFVSKMVLNGDKFIQKFCNNTGLKKPETPIKIYLDSKRNVENEVFPVPKWIKGFYSPDEKIIVLKTNKEFSFLVENSFLTVFQHEIVHAIIDNNHCKIPRWFNEGLASSFSRGFTINDGRTLLSLNKNEMNKFLEESSFNTKQQAPVSYALACGLVSYLRELGRTNINQLLLKSESEDFGTSFTSTLGIPFDTFLLLFQEAFLSRYTIVSLLISEEGLYSLMLLFAIYAILRKRTVFKKKLKEMEEQELLEQIELEKLKQIEKEMEKLNKLPLE